MIQKAEMAAVRSYLQELQRRLGAALAKTDGGVFAEETWQSALGRGCGLSLENSAVFERAGINYSEIAGVKLPPAATVRRPELSGADYQAMGVSLVAHPDNPHCPTAHLNVRFFAAETAWWFGGGMDLTPHYGYAEDCRHFHGVCKHALGALDPALYPRFKRQCDEYFYLKHRAEMRGIGGVFFDDFNERDLAHAFAVMRAVGDAFTEAYLPIIDKRKKLPFGRQQKQWQQVRRGRYVEFNLLYDRGTLFGLQTGGRAESILMSLPPLAAWNNAAPAGKTEARFAEEFLRPREWA